MSVRTAADEHRDQAVENVKDAISNLSRIVIEQCHGHDHWHAEYRAGITKSLQELIAIRDRL